MNIYQPLFYLTLGSLVYFGLLITLRARSSKFEENKKENSIPTIQNDDSWSDKESLTIVDIISETHDIKTFRFKRTNGKPFSIFKAGQFLSFQIKDEAKTLRSYSISGSCENTSTLQVSIKQIPQGIGSGWFHGLKIGDTVLAHPPSGLFTDDSQAQEQNRVFVCGGIGITPLLSMIKTNLDRANSCKQTLFYGMNSDKDMAFHKELDILAETYQQFTYYPVLTNAPDNWDRDTGFITKALIESKLKVDNSSSFYFCGPPVMTDGIMDSLKESGIANENIFNEKFVSPTTVDLTKVEGVNCEVEVNGKTLMYSGKETILDFLEDKNIDVDFACRSGVCGTCKIKLLEGDVAADSDSGLDEDDLKDGYFLSCVARPKNTKLKLKID